MNSELCEMKKNDVLFSFIDISIYFLPAALSSAAWANLLSFSVQFNDYDRFIAFFIATLCCSKPRLCVISDWRYLPIFPLSVGVSLIITNGGLASSSLSFTSSFWCLLSHSLLPRKSHHNWQVNLNVCVTHNVSYTDLIEVQIQVNWGVKAYKGVRTWAETRQFTGSQYTVVDSLLYL